MSDRSPSLQVSKLSKEYLTAGKVHPVLVGIQLELFPGDAAVIVAPPRSGKSTLISILGLFEKPSAGEVLIDGQAPHRLSPTVQISFRAQKIGILFPQPRLLPHCTVLENLLLPAIVVGKEGNDAPERARELLERTGLSHRARARPQALSDDERQRVALCRAVVNQPVLLLADEPDQPLDPSSTKSFGSLLVEMAQEYETALLCATTNPLLAEPFPIHRELVDGRLRDGWAAAMP